jgi:hypothetical protein
MSAKTSANAYRSHRRSRPACAGGGLRWPSPVGMNIPLNAQPTARSYIGAHGFPVK